MQQRDVLLEIVLSLLEDPLLEINKVKSVAVVDFLVLKPVYEMREVVGNLFAVEDSVYHMATEQPHLDLVA